MGHSPISALMLWLIPLIFAQPPSVCPQGTKSCCLPQNDPLRKACGFSLNESESHGTCVESAEVLRRFSPLSPDALKTVTYGYQKICKCRKNFDGPDCMRCKPGWSGTECDRPTVYYRKSYCELTAEEKESLHKAILQMKNTPSTDCAPVGDNFNQYDCFQYVHALSMTGFLNHDFAHRGPAFVTWHTEFLLRFERLLHEHNYSSSLGLPYWPWSNQTCTNMIIEDFGGNGDPTKDNEIQHGNYSSWLTIDVEGVKQGHIRREVGVTVKSPPQTQDLMTYLNMAMFDAVPYNNNSSSSRNFLEGFYVNGSSTATPPGNHNRAHAYIGGHMRIINISANDPIFYLNHAFVDCLVQQWKRRESLRAGEEAVYNPVSQAQFGHNRDDIMYPFYPFVSNADRWGSSLSLGYYCQPIVLDELKQNSSFQQGDERRDELLDVITKQLTPVVIPPGSTPPSVAIVGAGIAGLSSGFELKRAGIDVTILEATEDVGGRIFTPFSPFSFGQRSEGGAMRFPCSHWAPLRYAQLLGVQKRNYTYFNPEALILLSCLGPPVPTRVLFEPTYNDSLWNMLYQCYNITRAHERQPSDKLFFQAFQPYLEHLAVRHQEGRQEEAWRDIVRAVDDYSVRLFLTRKTGWSEEAADLFEVTSGVANLMHINVMEIFRDVFGWWWDDKCLYDLPAATQADPRYDGVRGQQGMVEFANGSSALPKAFLDHLHDDIEFGSSVVALDYTAPGEVSVTWRRGVRLISRRFDFVILAVPFNVVRTLQITPVTAYSVGKQRAMRTSHSIASTKIMVQVKNSSVVEGVSPMVPSHYAHKGVGNGGHSITDRMMMTQLVYPSNPVADGIRQVYVFYAWESEAEITGAIDAMTLRTEVEAVMAALHGPNVVIELVVKESWQDEFAELGAFVTDLPGQSNLYYPRSSPENRTCFAGDDKSRWHGWVQGAIVTGLSCAVDIHKQIVSTIGIGTRAADTYFIQSADKHVTSPSAGCRETSTCLWNVPGVPDYGEKGVLTASLVELEQNTTVPRPVSHVLVSGQVLNGAIKVSIGGNTRMLNVGDQYSVPAHTEYSLSTIGINVTSTNTSVLEYTPQWKEECGAPVPRLAAHIEPVPNARLSNASVLTQQMPLDASAVSLGIGVLEEQTQLTPFLIVDGDCKGSPCQTKIGTARLLSLGHNDASEWQEISFTARDGLVGAPLDSIVASLFLQIQGASCFQGITNWGVLTLQNGTNVSNVQSFLSGCSFVKSELASPALQKDALPKLCDTSPGFVLCLHAALLEPNSTSLNTTTISSVVQVRASSSLPKSFSWRVYKVSGLRLIEPSSTESNDTWKWVVGFVVPFLIIGGACLAWYCCRRKAVNRNINDLNAPLADGV